MIFFKVAKSVMMDLDDTIKIREKILKGETPSISAFVRKGNKKRVKKLNKYTAKT
ncbi:MAG: hypothetical protein WCF28_04490 [Methanobacterium sp.]|uniref:hypothetical protein n=1 Tax=Methanobacterium sp. TaxID=2164 RepID=UPI003C77CA9D